jgi:MutS-like protein
VSESSQHWPEPDGGRLTNSPETQTALEARLHQRIQAAAAMRDAITVRWNQVSNLRLILAALVIGFGFWWLRTGEGTWGLIAGGLALVFVGALIWHRRLGAMRADAATRVRLRQQAIARIHRDWRSLPEPLAQEVALDHPYAHDLDLVGHGSLQQLIDTTQTPAGRRTLLHWLTNGAPEGEINARQHIATDFARDEQWRENLATSGSRIGEPGGDVELLLAWLETAATERIGARHLIALLLAIGTVAVGVLYVLGVASSAWLLPFIVANAILTFVAPNAGQLSQINSHQRSLSQYRAVLPVAEAAPGSSAETDRMRGRLTAPGGSASHQLAALDRALAFVIPAGTIIWFPLQLALNWDLLVEARLRRLAASIGPHLRGWIDAIGEIEALSSLGNASALNPDWTWPAVKADADAFAGSALGHPLIPATRRVANDVTVGPGGSVLIVTGSNMAGKSTLLRTVGLNAVLARAGGPVCAAGLRMPNYPIWSSVRIQDSLEEGVSLYMAELLRLKQIVDAARSGPILYLLDEILHGTNTTERRIAARSIIRQLVRTGSIGAVSTHDLELIDTGLADASILVHLVDQVVDGPNGPEMMFDYRLRPGLAPSSNALRLLNLVGLGEESPV